ncbi:uncharacterized protein LOC108832023 isoform X3 [Raphanus sativus]|uniref:Uncharacterized protein LOC108832023 isoform X3 n=1 Tax=Raphanus sativus TaxID=3726 RepID=A0A6J0LLZ6_RAPSA|nr:uncharacterized protein LOC108832023 isoform X3 [Raphanus sativus]
MMVWQLSRRLLFLSFSVRRGLSQSLYLQRLCTLLSTWVIMLWPRRSRTCSEAQVSDILSFKVPPVLVVRTWLQLYVLIKRIVASRGL